MFIYALLLFTFALALLSLFLVFVASGRIFRHSWSLFILGLSLGLFIYLYGTWIYLTVDAKWGFGICLLLTLLLGFFRKKKNTPVPRAWRFIGNLFFSVLFLTLSTLYFTGTTGKARAIDLAFP